MKKIVLTLTFLILVFTCFSQTPTPPTPAQDPAKGTKEYHLEKREANMVRGWILTPGGVALIGLGYAMTLNELENDIRTLGQNNSNGTGAGLMVVAGVASIIVGTISFVSAGSNKRKARSLSIGYEQVPLSQHEASITRAVPTVGVKISF